MITVEKKVNSRGVFNCKTGPKVINIKNQKPNTPTLIKFKKIPLKYNRKYSFLHFLRKYLDHFQ